VREKKRELRNPRNPRKLLLLFDDDVTRSVRVLDHRG
jgi:hypothetical protein